MPSVQSVIAFAETVKQGGFARAARSLGLSPSAVAKNVARLERDLSVRLLHRTTRQLSLTSDGRNLFERCALIVAELEALQADAEGVRAEPRGTLRLNMPSTYGRRVIVPLVAELARRHPDLHFDLSFSDHLVDVIKEGLDAVIRIGALADSSLVARTIDAQQLVVMASRPYLKRRGAPDSPADLGGHACAVFRLPQSGRLRPWSFADGRRSFEVNPHPRLVLDDGDALVSAASEGLGLIQVPSYIVDGADSRLVEVLARYRPRPIPISVVHAGKRQVTPRLRVLLESLLELRKRRA